MMRFLMAHWGAIGVGATWLLSHLRKSIPARGTPSFWTSWAYNIVSGDAPEKKSPA
jgi:hypothetical protein